MPDPEVEVERAAQFLATHAVLLLGLGLLAALVALVVTVRIVARFKGSLLRNFTALVQRFRDIQALNHFVARTSVLIPHAFLAACQRGAIPPFTPGGVIQVLGISSVASRLGPLRHSAELSRGHPAPHHAALSHGVQIVVSNYKGAVDAIQTPATSSTHL